MTLVDKIKKLKELVTQYETTQDTEQKKILFGQIIGFIAAL